MMEEGIIPQSEYEKAAEYCRNELLTVAEFFTGVACTSKAERHRSVGYIVQGVIGGRGLTNLQREIEYYVNAGKIKKDFVTSTQGERCLVELLKFLEQEIPDNDRLELLKRIYIVSATEEINDRESPLPLQFMQIARNLTQGEIVVLFAAYRIDGIGFLTISESLSLMVEQTGLQYEELVRQHIERLEAKRLMDASIKRLTPMGRAFCKYVRHYDEQLQTPTK